MIDDLDNQIAATQTELGLIQEKTSRFKILHSLVKFSFASTKQKRTTSSTTNHQECPEEPDDLDVDLDLQIAKAKAELDLLRSDGEIGRVRTEQQRNKSQVNLEKKTRTLQTSMKRQIKAPDKWTRQIVAMTFNEPSRNRFCLDMETKNVHAICNMWWMNRQLELQLDALDDMNELLTLERTKLKDEAHKNRAQMLVLTEMYVDPPVEADNLEFQQQQQQQQLDNDDYQAERDQQQMEISILEQSQPPLAPITKPNVTYDIQFSPRLAFPSPTVCTPNGINRKLPRSQNYPTIMLL
jgi:hypothetical protein